MKIRRIAAAVVTSFALVGGLASPASAVAPEALAKGLRHLKQVEEQVPGKQCESWTNWFAFNSFKKELETRTGYKVPMTREQLEEGLLRDKASREARIKDYSATNFHGSREWEGNQKAEFDEAAQRAGDAVIAKAHSCNFIRK